MLHSMRRLGSGLFAKIMVVFIAAAFGLWGVGDVLRSGGSSYAAKVGGETISVAEFQHQRTMLERQLQAMGIQNIESGKLDVSVLRQLIQQKLLVQVVQSSGLRVNDQLLAKTLRQEPSFRNPDGSFNANAFHATLVNARINEATFLAQLKDETAGKFLLASIDMEDITPSAAVMALADAAANETRDVALITIPARVPYDQITEDAAKEYYESHKLTFYLTPPSRAIEYVTFAHGELDALIDRSITDDMRSRAAAADPSLSKEQINQQLRNDARENVGRNLNNSIIDALAGGSTLGGAMNKLGIKAQSRLLEHVTDESLKAANNDVEKTAIDQGLKLNDGEISGVLTSASGVNLMVALKSLIPSTPRPYEQVQADVKNRLGLQLARDASRAKAQEVKAALTKADKPWQEAIAPFGVYGRPVSNLPRPTEGRALPSGIPQSLYEAIFERNVGQTAGPLTLPNGDQLMAVITQSHQPKPNLNAKIDAKTSKEMATGLNQDVQNNAFNYFTQKHPVKINEQAFNHSNDANQ